MGTEDGKRVNVALSYCTCTHTNHFLLLNLDELEDSKKTSKAKKSPDSNKASKKSDDTNDYLDDDDDDDDDDDTTDNSEDGSNESKDVKIVNDTDESESDANSEHKSTDDAYRGDNERKTDLTKQYQEQNIAWNSDSHVLKPVQTTVESGLNKTPLPSTSDKSKYNDEPASDGTENSQPGLSKEGGGLPDNTTKEQVLSQESTVSNTENNNDQTNADTSSLGAGLSKLPKTGRAGIKQSDGTNKLAATTEKDSGKNADNGATNTAAMDNNTPGLTQASDDSGSDNEKVSENTANTETDDAEEMNEQNVSDAATDVSNSDPNVKTNSDTVTSNVHQSTATSSKNDDNSAREQDTTNDLSKSAIADKDAKMKELNQNAEKTQPSVTTMDDDHQSSSSTSSPNTGLPNKEQMEAVSRNT